MAAPLPSTRSLTVTSDWTVPFAVRLMQETSAEHTTLRHALGYLAGRCQAAQAYLQTLDEAGDAADVIVPEQVSGVGSAQVWDRIQSNGWVEAIHERGATTLFMDGLGIGVPVMYRDQMLAILILTHGRGKYAAGDVPALETAAALLGGAIMAARGREQQHDLAQRSAQLQRDLTAMAVHDLRVPLQSIRTTLTALTRMVDDSKVDKVIGLGMQATDELSSTIESLLDIDRLESGRVQLQARESHLDGLVEHAFETLLPIASAAQHALIADLPPRLPPVMVDRALIHRVIVNLVSNAVKYTPPGGVIRVGAQAKEQWVRVSVSDSGPGVPRHLRGAIFDKYYRLREHVHHDGVGLGLAFCRLAVEAHGGTIEVESDSSGARFSFTIPVAARDADDTAPLVDFWMQ